MNATRICSVDGCSRKVKARGLCEMHYLRLRRLGNTGAAAPLISKSTTGICSFPDCGRAHHANSLCDGHLRQLRRGNKLSPLYTYPLAGEPVEVRLAALADKSGDCWIWQGQRDHGYGVVYDDGRKQYAHRASYELHHGEIPAGLQIDHKCRNGLCVRPSHLHAVTHFENAQNKTLQSNNTTGFRGVYKVARAGGRFKYVVEAHSFGIKYRGGTYDTAEEANEAAVALRNKVQTNNRKDWE